jgi:hypothetical protein
MNGTILTERGILLSKAVTSAISKATVFFWVGDIPAGAVKTHKSYYIRYGKTIFLKY